MFIFTNFEIDNYGTPIEGVEKLININSWSEFMFTKTMEKEEGMWVSALRLEY